MNVSNQFNDQSDQSDQRDQRDQWMINDHMKDDMKS